MKLNKFIGDKKFYGRVLKVAADNDTERNIKFCKPAR